MDAKRAVVTGAGTGIGRATTALLLTKGFDVVAVGRSGESLDKMVRELGDQGRRVIPLSLDVRDGSALRDALAEGGPVDALVANAGVCKQSRIDDPDADDIWQELISINLDGMWQTFRTVVPLLKPEGCAVAVSSGLGKLGRAGYSAYTASKHGVLGLVKCLAKELAPKRITVNAVCPGWVDTDMARQDLVRTAQEESSTFDQVKESALEGFRVAFLWDTPLWLLKPESVSLFKPRFGPSCYDTEHYEFMTYDTVLRPGCAKMLGRRNPSL